MTVRIHIERLVLDGVGETRADADLVRAALEAELGRHLAEAPAESWTSLAVPSLRVAPVPMPRGDGAVRVGRVAGAALAAGLRR